MHIFETLLFIFNIIFTVFYLKNRLKVSDKMKLLPYLTFILFIMHLYFESSRWQLYPLYLLNFIYLVFVILPVLKVDKIKIKKHTKKTIVVCLILLLFISSASVLAFPVYKMPLASGHYPIGTESYDLVDPSRNAIYSDNLNNDRKIKIQIWYPADSVEGFNKVPWFEDGLVVAQALARDMNLPSFMLNHTALVMSNSYGKAPISDDLETYPVVIISHGWSGFRNLHTDLAEELASQGYIVVGIDHTYGSQVTVFNDKEVAYLNYEALPKRKITPNFLEYANTLVTTYAQDIKFTIDELEKINLSEEMSRFSGKLDLSNIGLLGHSTGGGADVALAIEDDRIKSLIGMDAWVEPIEASEIEKGLNMPALFIRSGQWETGYNNENLLSLINRSSVRSELYQINDTTHYDFSMVYMYSPLTKYIKLTGKYKGEYVSLILKEIISDFFNVNLRNTDREINITDKWKEVIKIK